MKTPYFLSLSALALGFAALPSTASAAIATAVEAPSAKFNTMKDWHQPISIREERTNQTSPTSSTSGCATGTSCPGTSQVGVVTIGGIQGSFMGVFGSYNQAGQPVTDDTLEGGVEGYKEGEVLAFGEVTLTGTACPGCAQTGINARVTAQERAGVAVWLSGSKPGVTYGGANSATVATVGAIGTVFKPYVAPATTTHPAN